jgi:hypothetical protein
MLSQVRDLRDGQHREDGFLHRLLLFSFIALCPVQDFFLRGSPLAMLGGSPASFPLLVLCILAAGGWMLRGSFRVLRLGIMSVLYAFLLTIYGVIEFGMTFYGHNLLSKSLGSLAVLSLFLSAIFIPRYDMRATVRPACYVAFVVLVLGFCFCHPNPFNLPGLFNNAVFHYYPAEGLDRPRGLSSEPSFLSVTIISIGLLCANFSHKPACKALFVFATLGLLVASGSKGGILVIFICIGILAMFRFHKWYQLPALVLLVLPLSLIATAWIPTLFPEEGIVQSGSVQTRASMILCAIETVRHHPLGVGFSGYLPAVSRYLPASMSNIQAVSPLPLDFTEVSEYLGDSPTTGTKTLLFDEAMCFGLPFVALFLVLIVRLLQRLRALENTILFIGVMAVAIAFCSYVSLSGEYATAILLGIAIRETGGSLFATASHFGDRIGIHAAHAVS